MEVGGGADEEEEEGDTVVPDVDTLAVYKQILAMLRPGETVVKVRGHGRTQNSPLAEICAVPMPFFFLPGLKVFRF